MKAERSTVPFAESRLEPLRVFTSIVRRGEHTETRWLRLGGGNAVLGYRETRKSGCWAKRDAAARIHTRNRTRSERRILNG
ncbi:hypothetical protein E1301_Tti008900 [Triplophysa tibetana]|uniref:Uncharacterized protein n=1 Tax=Triplophysa tibetana TaxID=1572043 RepID=A0A5A9P4Z4_9TELE|nr:hypothetical protein E1301_Tti008900 [Triplophysa tibetana]